MFRPICCPNFHPLAGQRKAVCPPKEHRPATRPIPQSCTACSQRKPSNPACMTPFNREALRVQAWCLYPLHEPTDSSCFSFSFFSCYHTMQVGFFPSSSSSCSLNCHQAHVSPTALRRTCLIPGQNNLPRPRPSHQAIPWSVRLSNTAPASYHLVTPCQLYLELHS